MPESPYLFDLIRPILAGASLASQRQQANRDAMLMAEQFRRTRQIEDYQNRMATVQETQERRLREVFDREQAFRKRQELFSQTFGALAPFVGPQNAANIAAVRTKYIPPQMEGDMLQPQGQMPADVKNWQYYQDLVKTDPDAAAKFLEFTNQGGMEVEQSPGGGLVVRTGKRGQAPVGIVTKATEAALGGLEVARKIDKVIGKITPGTVGLGANLGRLVDSTVIGDIFPEAVSRDRVTVRQTLDMLSSDITRMMKSDSQIAEAERKLVERAIPRVKLAQSAEEARTQLFQIRGIIGKGKRSWLEAAQQTIPQEYWNEDEIAAEAKRKLAAGDPEDAVTKWAQDMLYSSLYPNRFNQDMDKFLMYAPASSK